MRKNFTPYFAAGVLSWAVIGAMSNNAQGQIYTTSAGTGTIGYYNSDGSPINSSLVSGLDAPYALWLYENDLFVANFGSGTIGEYTTSGATVNASLITGLSGPAGLTVSGG